MTVSASVYILNVRDSRTDAFRGYNNNREKKNNHSLRAHERSINMPIVFEKKAGIGCKVVEASGPL
jgi:hypothetical protein